MSQLQAQRIPIIQQPATKNAVIDPGNTRALDSIEKMNEISLVNPAKNLPGKKSIISASSNMPNIKEVTSTGIPATGPSYFRQAGTGSLTNTSCYAYSGKDFLFQDSLFLWSTDPTLTADGNVILSGEFADYSPMMESVGGFCMKTDLYGNVIWAKLFDSVANLDYDFLNLMRSIELHDGSILLAGRTTNKVSGNADFVLTKLDADGNLLWLKTYESKYWHGYGGSGDYFAIRDLEEDPATGEVYFVGHHYTGLSTVTKVDPADGDIVWSKSYVSWESERAFGIIIHPTELLLFTVEGYYTSTYIHATALDKITGDTLYSKHNVHTDALNTPHLYTTFEVMQIENGHYLLSGRTTGFFEYPVFTGTVDLYHAAVVELDQNLDFVRAYGFKNRQETGGNETRISFNGEGLGIFTMSDYEIPYVGQARIVYFKEQQIYQQRKRLYINEGTPYEPHSIPLANGGFLNIKGMHDSIWTNTEGARIDYYRMHSSDTLSSCIGVEDSVTSTWNFVFNPAISSIQAIDSNVFTVSRIKTYGSFNFGTTTTPGCEVISHCDTMSLQASADTICPGTTVTITIQKNAECGSLIPIEYDTSFVHQVIALNDSTYEFHFDQPGSGYIKASLMGCVLHKDSVLVEVIDTRYSLDLGPDSVICPGNEVLLNAGIGFASYLWQDGSTDSVFTVTSPGIYHLVAVNGCGTTYRDTIEVVAHPPIPFSAGVDRVKCNNDTILLNATPGFLNYNWGPDYQINVLTGNSVVVQPQTDTLYYVRAEKTPGCYAYDTVHVQVFHSPPVSLGADRSICTGDSLLLDAGTGFSSYTWSNGAVSQQVIVKTANTFSVQATTVEGCSSYDTLQVLSLLPLPQVQLNENPLICEGDSRILNAGSFISYLWHNGSTASAITVNDIGTFYVTVWDQYNCRGSDTVRITETIPLPTGFLPADTVMCNYGTLRINANGNFNNYLWNNNSSTSGITITAPGLYWLQVTDEYNCIGKDSIIIGLKECLKGFHIPSAFTPDGDGLNDHFKPIIGGNVEEFLFTIYNRWGQEVFKTTDPARGWDGKYKGTVQDGNVFIWACRFRIEGEKTEMRKGTVMLLR